MLGNLYQAPQVEAPKINEQEQKLNEIITHLSWCESRHRNGAFNPADPVSGSYGRFQFKIATWNYYLDKYQLFPEAEPAERQNLIWDGWAQEQVVRKVLEEPNGWRNWTACLKRYYQ